MTNKYINASTTRMLEQKDNTAPFNQYYEKKFQHWFKNEYTNKAINHS